MSSESNDYHASPAIITLVTYDPTRFAIERWLDDNVFANMLPKHATGYIVSTAITARNIFSTSLQFMISTAISAWRVFSASLELLASSFRKLSNPFEYLYSIVQTAYKSPYNATLYFLNRTRVPMEKFALYQCDLQIAKAVLKLQQHFIFYKPKNTLYDWFFPPILSNLCLLNSTSLSTTRFAINLFTASLGLGEIIKEEVQCVRCFRIETGKRNYDMIYLFLIASILILFVYSLVFRKRAGSSNAQVFVEQQPSPQVASQPQQLQQSTAGPNRSRESSVSIEVPEQHIGVVNQPQQPTGSTNQSEQNVPKSVV